MILLLLYFLDKKKKLNLNCHDTGDGIAIFLIGFGLANYEAKASDLI